MASNLATTPRKKREKVTGVMVTSKTKLWNYYTKLSGAYVECKVCKKTFSFQNGTTSMREHLLKLHSVHSVDIPEIKDQSELDFSDQEGAAKRLKQALPSNSLCSSITESQAQAIANLLLEMIYRDLHPLTMVKEKGFVKLLAYLEPNIDLPCQTQLAGMLWHKYTIMKQQLKCCLQAIPSVVISIENWCDHSQRAYLSVTANIIDGKWKFCRYLLETQSVHQVKTQDDLAEHLQVLLGDYGLSTNKVSYIVLDRSSLVSLYDKCFKETYAWTSLCCTANILQHCVQAGLEVQEVKEALNAARGLVSYFQEDFKASCILSLKLEGMKKPRLTLDTDTYWTSTLEMCQNLLDLKWAVLSVLEQQKGEDLSEQQWKLLQDLVLMLKTVWIATEFLQEPQNASISSVVPCVFGVFVALGQTCEASNGAIKAAATQIRAEMSKYWNLLDEGILIANPAIIASFLDPRFKELRFLKPCARAELHMRVKNMLSQQNEQYDSNQLWVLPHVMECTNDSLELSNHNSPSIESDSLYDLLLGRDPTACMPEVHQQLENYIVEPICKRTGDPLQWWNSNHQRYPALAGLARLYLAIPATTVEPGHAFGRPGPLQSRRAALQPKHIDTILFLHNNKDLLDWNIKVE
ncbi:E3 SUMO-protein ligase ZBED1-like isoform X2 [Hyperolius riggenbachi]